MSSKFSSITILLRSLLPIGFLILTACGGGSSDSDPALSLQPQSNPQVFISGAGIKGPLAYASVELYALDAQFDGLYDPQVPLGVATTNSYAEITGLPVPADVTPPYILVIDGSNAIDRNTGVAPVIKTLVTVITPEALQAGQAIYATAYTTLAYHMLRKDLQGDGLQGDGLRATYYNDTTLTQKALERVDASIDFRWGAGSPDAAVNTNKFSARWTGLVEPDYSENYTFYTTADDGVRLWVDGKKLVDHWYYESKNEYSATIRLTAGQKYSIVMEYYEASGDSGAKLKWSSASQPKTVIARNNLYSTGATASQRSYLDLATDLSQYGDMISRALGFGMPDSVNIFATPPIITETTTTVAEQELVVNYRAAIEAFSSMVYQVSQDSAQGFSSDTVLEYLAFDLYSDGIIDDSFDGQTISGIDTTALSQNPLAVTVTNTDYQVRDMVSLIDDERSLVGSSANVPFHKDEIVISLRTALLDSTIDYSQEAGYSEPVDNTASTLLLTSIIASAPVSAGDIFNLDFNHHDLHTYSDNDVRNDWDSNGNITLDPDAMEIFNDPAPGGTRDKVLRVNYEGGEYGYGGVSGGQWFKMLDDYEEIYYSFDVYFEPGFDFVKTGKLPGPRSTDYRENRVGKANTKPDGTDIWTAGLIWSFDGELKSYVYHANQSSNFGQNIHWNDGADGENTYFTPGKWHRVEMRVKLNTPGVLDGRIEGWFDGEKRLDTSRIMFRMPGGENLKIGTFFFYTFFGGGDSSFAATKDEHVYFDNFVLSTEPITH